MLICSKRSSGSRILILMLGIVIVAADFLKNYSPALLQLGYIQIAENTWANVNYSMYGLFFAGIICTISKWFFSRLAKNLKTSRELIQKRRDTYVNDLLKELGDDLTFALREFFVGEQEKKISLMKKDLNSKLDEIKMLSNTIIMKNESIKGYEEFFSCFKNFEWCGNCMIACFDGNISKSESKEQTEQLTASENTRAPDIINKGVSSQSIYSFAGNEKERQDLKLEIVCKEGCRRKFFNTLDRLLQKLKECELRVDVMRKKFKEKNGLPISL